MDELTSSLADLHGHPGFQQLLNELATLKGSILGRMSGKYSDKKLAHLARCYQIANDFHVFLKTSVDTAFERMQTTVADGLEDDKLPEFTPRADWYGRFQGTQSQLWPDSLKINE